MKMKKINKKILAISFTPKIKIAIQTALATSENVFSKKIFFTAGEFCKGEIKISIIVANKVKFTKKENRFEILFSKEIIPRKYKMKVKIKAIEPEIKSGFKSRYFSEVVFQNKIPLDSVYL